MANVMEHSSENKIFVEFVAGVVHRAADAFVEEAAESDSCSFDYTNDRSYCIPDNYFALAKYSFYYFC